MEIENKPIPPKTQFIKEGKSPIDKVIIGNSDYTREQMEKGECSVFAIGCSSKEFLGTIMYYESQGYDVKFETSLFRRIFGLGIIK